MGGLAAAARWLFIGAGMSSGELRNQHCGPEQSAGAFGLPASHMHVLQLHRSVSTVVLNRAPAGS